MQDRSLSKKAIHRWVQTPDEGLWRKSSRHRTYACERCGAGPVRVDALLGKANINRIAVKNGILSDCNAEMVKRVLDA